jgi:DNA polymerase III delta subunit
MSPTPGASKPFVVAYGAEEFLLDRVRMWARTWTGRQVLTFSGDGLTDQELVSTCQMASYDESPRTVIVDEANKIKGDKALKAYINDKSDKDTGTILVAILRTEKLPDVWAQAGKKGRLISHPKLKTYESNNEVLRWIEGEAERAKIRLGKGVADALFLHIGHDLGRLAGDIGKLQVFVGRGAEATLADLKKLIAPSASAEAWQVAEAAVDKDFRRAMNLLSTLYKSEGDDAYVPLAYSLMKQIEKLMVARYMLDEKLPDDDMASALGMHPFRFKRFFLPMVRKHSVQDLIRHMGRLSLLDSQVKSSARSKRSLIELAVLSIAA